MDESSPANGLVFVDELPAPNGGRRNWSQIAGICDENPGEWLRVGLMDRAVMTRIRDGLYSVDPELYEVATRVEPDIQYRTPTQVTLYLRRKVEESND